MIWRAIYNSSDGRLRSVGSVWTEPPGTDFREYAEKPDDSENMWDEATRNFIPRPPKILIDRMDDLEGHPTFLQFQEVFDTLTSQQKAKVRNALRMMLWSEQFRNVAESIKIGGDPDE